MVRIVDEDGNRRVARAHRGASGDCGQATSTRMALHQAFKPQARSTPALHPSQRRSETIMRCAQQAPAASEVGAWQEGVA
jgi:hypothetical protein